MNEVLELPRPQRHEMTFIPSWKVEDVWEAAVPGLRKVIAKQTGWTLESIRALCKQGQMHLWMVDNEAVLVTQIQPYPAERLCVVVLAGGTGVHAWKDNAIVELEKYARHHGCNAITVIGREGWQKIYPGLEATGEVVMRKQL